MRPRNEFPTLKQMCALMRHRDVLVDYQRIKLLWDDAINESFCCDDINLDQPLAGIIADLQKDRERLYAELKALKEVQP